MKFVNRLSDFLGKYMASDFILSVYGMAVRRHHRPQPLPQDQHIQIADFMLYFMSVLHAAFLLSMQPL